MLLLTQLAFFVQLSLRPSPHPKIHILAFIAAVHYARGCWLGSTVLALVRLVHGDRPVPANLFKVPFEVYQVQLGTLCWTQFALLFLFPLLVAPITKLGVRTFV